MKLSLTLFCLLPTLAPASALTERGDALLERGARDHARAVYRQALKESPCDPQALAGLERSGAKVATERANCAKLPAPTPVPGWVGVDPTVVTQSLISPKELKARLLPTPQATPVAKKGKRTKAVR